MEPLTLYIDDGTKYLCKYSVIRENDWTSNEPVCLVRFIERYKWGKSNRHHHFFWESFSFNKAAV